MKKLKNFVRIALYRLGIFSLIQALRNRRTLTTFMFHRVLPSDSVEFRNAEREFTFSVEGFGRCLDFIQKHYQVITLADLQRWQQGNVPLPDNAALITFDDGWLDTFTNAYPELKRRKMKAVLFVASEVPVLQHDRWWQDALVTVFSDSEATTRLLQRLRLEITNEHQAVDRRKLNALLSQLPEADRMAILSEAGNLVSLPRQMLNEEELRQMQNDTFELGAHGHTHAPLTSSLQPKKELEISLNWLKSTSARQLSMSFPHGAFNANLVHEAYQTGFQFVFTSVPELLSTDTGLNCFTTFSRIHMPENQWTCDSGKVSFPLLATFLFFRPKAK